MEEYAGMQVEYYRQLIRKMEKDFVPGPRERTRGINFTQKRGKFRLVIRKRFFRIKVV